MFKLMGKEKSVLKRNQKLIKQFHKVYKEIVKFRYLELGLPYGTWLMESPTEYIKMWDSLGWKIGAISVKKTKIRHQ